MKKKEKKERKSRQINLRPSVLSAKWETLGVKFNEVSAKPVFIG